MPRNFSPSDLVRYYQTSTAYSNMLASRPGTDYDRYVTLVRRFVPLGEASLKSEAELDKPHDYLQKQDSESFRLTFR